MPDAIVIGAGIVGVSTALELAEAGAEVLVLERDGLAAGASGRAQGILNEPDEPALRPLYRESLARYLALAEESPVRFDLDADPVGLLRVAFGEDDLTSLEGHWAGGEPLDGDDIASLEPALAVRAAGGRLLADARRVDPGALTIAVATAARAAGADVRTGVEVRRLLRSRGGRVDVVTDEAVLQAPALVVAAGAWSRRLLRPLGHELAVRPVRGWLAVTAAGPPLLRHIVEDVGGEAPDGPGPEAPVTLARLADGETAALGPAPEHSLLAHPARDGGVFVGSARSPALREGDESADALRLMARRAIELFPDLAAREVATTWTGLRPGSPDGIPFIDWLEPGLLVCAGHTYQGILTGAGSGRLAGELVLGREPYTPAAPYALGRTTPRV